MKTEIVESSYTLSPMQHGMLFHSLYAAHSGVYVQQMLCNLREDLHRQAFMRAWERVVERHPVLRTSFRWYGLPEPLQDVHRRVALPVEQADWRALSSDERERRLLEHLRRDRERGFNFTQAPLMRLALLRLADADYQLVWTSHHALLDGRSRLLILKELFALYESYCLDQDLPLETPRPYREYIEWLEQQDWTGAEIFWRQTLKGFTTPTPLALARASGPSPDGAESGEQWIQLSPAITSGLRSLARQEGLSLSTMVQAAWALLLGRYGGVDEVVFGITRSCRRTPVHEFGSTVGLLINTLPLRLHIPAAMPLTAWLKELRAQYLSINDYAHTPLIQVQEWSDVPKGARLFESILVFENYQLNSTLRSQGGDWKRREFRLLEQTNYPLAVAGYDGTQLLLKIIYHQHLFAENTIQRMLGHLQTLLAAFVANPAQPLSELPLLSREEREQVLYGWNRTGRDYGPALCLHQLFEAQVRRTPDAVALVCGEKRLTYTELNRRANQLAHYLRGLGVGPESLVGVLLERSVEMVVSLLGVLKAGGAYLPLDPAYPRQRVLYMLEDADLSLVLTLAPLAQQFHHSSSTTSFLCLDSLHQEISQLSPVSLPDRSLPDHLAYLIYTSGSTGLPKGAMNSHRAICNRLRWMQETYDLQADDAVLQKTPLSFDVSVWEFFWPLMTGARLVLARPDGHQDAAYLARLIQRERITTLHFVPSMMHLFIAEPAAPLCESLRRVICSGEALSLALQQRYYARMHAPLHNLYGPTEAAVDVTSWACERESERASVPIGRPIANTQIYLLDQGLRAVPVGVVAELYIGGEAVGRGYWRRPELTAQRFIPDPHGAARGGRLYRTGDLARHGEDGSIEYLGRVDQQVKVRGMRIELGEVEGVLGEHAGVEEAVVLVREVGGQAVEDGGQRAAGGGQVGRSAKDGGQLTGDGPADQRLVAYLIPSLAEAAVVRRLLQWEASGEFPPSSRYELPNGLSLLHLNQGETRFLYRELFEEQSYLRHGITLRAGDCVFDVGANIGLFCLALWAACPEVEVHAFEPIPPVCRVLRANTRLYGMKARVYECGLSNRAGSAEFTYYPHVSIISGSHAEENEEREVLRHYLLSEGEEAEKEGGSIVLGEMGAGGVEELLAETLRTESYQCRLRTLSEVMREAGVERIDLLKIDVEKSEQEVLEGIEEQDWEKIRQVVVEVHDSGGRLERIRQRLAQKGYELVVEQDRRLAGTGLYNIYGRRREAESREAENKEQPGAAREQTASGEQTDGREMVKGQLWRYSISALKRELEHYLKARLPDYMLPSSMILLAGWPLSANGKLDRQALPTPSWGREEGRAAYVSPRTGVETEVALIWERLLGVERVGAEDNFFELGGHSLLGMQMMTRVRERVGVELGLRELFERPTVRGLSERIAARLGAAAGERGEGDRGEGDRGEGDRAGEEEEGERLGEIERGEGELPLSYAQQRLWVLDQLQPGSAVYNIARCIRLTGPLNLSILEQSLAEIMRRHETLRTRFAVEREEPCQLVVQAHPLSLPVTDLTALDQDEREAAIQHHALIEAEQPFDLAGGPMMRGRLLRLSPQQHILLLTLHHISSDGWSMSILWRELGQLYRAFSEGRPSPLPDLPLQYADFALWQRAHLSGQLLHDHLSYWRSQLAGAPALLQLPIAAPRPALQSHRGASLHFTLSHAELVALKELSQRHSVTLFMSLLSAFALLLARYSGQPEIVIGTPIAGRTRAEVEELIGFFINTLVLRIEVRGEESFRQLVQRVREVCLGAYAHQELPFEKLVEELQPERSLSHAPLCQVLFNMQTSELDAPRLPNLKVSVVQTSGDYAKFDLTLSVQETKGKLAGSLQYRTDLFAEAAMHRMLGHYMALLKGIAGNSERRVSELPLLTEDEARLLEAWNDTSMEFATPQTLPELFEAQAARTPESLAVMDEGERLSYRELNRRANQLAHYLRAAGVGPETLVGIYMERSLDMIVAVLGILKAGGGYLPLDTALPRERLAFLLKDSGAALLLVQEKLRNALPESAPNVLVMDAGWSIISEHGEENPSHILLAENVAYVIYTSGSTGVPKGVLIEHRQIANYLQALKERVKYEPGASFALVQPLTVDSSQTVFFPCLTSGGSLHVISQERAGDPAALSDYFTRHRIDFLKITPSHLAALQTWPEPDRLLPARWLLLGGEASPLEWARNLQRLAPGCAIFSHYGPTETTVGVLTYLLPEDAAAQDCEIVPTGHPLANVQARVLDDYLQPVPPGIPGELHIGGASVARCYLNAPARTAEKFIPDPFSDKPGARLYKTGDSFRHLPDGTLLFLGRRDHQVKIRGYRVELGEIEAALRQHPSIREAVVVAQEDENGAQRLVAYVLADEESQPTGELRAYLQEKLPEYMLPQAFVRLEKMPLTAQGKIDRRALPSPATPPETAEDYAAPRTPLEEMMTDIWQELLGTERVGILDNFFELGGHSLLATRLISRLRELLRVEVPLQILFEAPTVLALSQAIIAREARPGQTEKIARLFMQLERMSYERAQELQDKRGES
jgi:amino acid adenylation domain-containing protein/FkbM family methyltransferase